MAVTLTAAQLATAIRVGDSADETATVTRLLAVAGAMVAKHAPNAPDAIQDEAVVRIAGYLFDAPASPGGTNHSAIGRNSGAWGLLLPYRVHRAGTTAEAVDAAQDAVGSADNPVTNVAVVGGDLLITFADASTRTETLPAGMGGGGDGDDAYAWATEGDTSLIPDDKLPAAYTLPAAAPGVRGGVQAITNAIIDTDTSTGIFGWAITHVRRAAGTLIEAWAKVGIGERIPIAKLPVIPNEAESRDATNVEPKTWNPLRVHSAISGAVEEYARVGTGSKLPFSRLQFPLIYSGIDFDPANPHPNFQNKPLNTLAFAEDEAEHLVKLWRKNGSADTAWTLELSISTTAGTVASVAARLLPPTNADGERGYQLRRLADADGVEFFQAASSAAVERFDIRPNVTYAYSAGLKQVTMTADYPAGHTRATMRARAKTASLTHDSAYSGTLGVAMVEQSDATLVGYQPPIAGVTIPGDLFQVDFRDADIRLEFRSDADLPANARDGFRIRLTLF